jgi:DNA-nicking Smr family endonuclease
MMDDMKSKKRASEGARPFRDLAELIAKAGVRLQSGDAEPEAENHPPDDTEGALPEDDGELFARAMEGVERVQWSSERLSAPDPAPPKRTDAESEGLRLMEAAMEGIPEPLVLDHPEYIEGWVGVAGMRYLPNLRNGMYSIQSQLDLHGLGREEARRAVEEFVLRASRERSCCVKIVHGRGINSPNARAVLKESLQHWLSTRRMSKCVVAYASAPFTDGGVGAVYVLLRGPRGRL